MENYCVLSINKIHTLGNLKMCHKHNFRELPLKHVDLSKIEDNEELIDFTALIQNIRQDFQPKSLKCK